MSGGIVGRNPCPKCGKPPHLMAGINVPGGDKAWRYLVCWACRMIRLVKKGEEWGPMRRWA